MFFVAGVLAVLAGLFYAASHHEIGSLGVTLCRYGPVFLRKSFLSLGRSRTRRRVGSISERAIVVTPSRIGLSHPDAAGPRRDLWSTRAAPGRSRRKTAGLSVKAKV
jgi:hypothetical protein